MNHKHNNLHMELLYLKMENSPKIKKLCFKITFHGSKSHHLAPQLSAIHGSHTCMLTC